MFGKIIRPVLLLLCVIVFFVSPESAFNENNVFNELKFLSTLGIVLIVLSFFLDMREMN